MTLSEAVFWTQFSYSIAISAPALLVSGCYTAGCSAKAQQQVLNCTNAADKLHSLRCLPRFAKASYFIIYIVTTGDMLGKDNAAISSLNTIWSTALPYKSSANSSAVTKSCLPPDFINATGVLPTNVLSAYRARCRLLLSGVLYSPLGEVTQSSKNIVDK